MKSAQHLLTLAACLTSASTAIAEENSIVRTLRKEASLLAIEIDSSKSGLAPISRTGSSRWGLSISPSLSYQRFGKLSVNAGANNGSAMLPNLMGSGGENLPDIGSAGALGDRAYNDGFVNQTGPTADTGRTWFWGYDNASQINSSSDLIMSATGSRALFRESYSDLGGRSSHETLDGITPRLDFHLTAPGGTRLPFQSILISFAYFSDDVNSGFNSFTGEQALDQYRLDFRDTYTTSALLLPGAGYGGSLAGPGVTIPNLPDQRETTETLTGAEIGTLRNEVSLDIEVDSFSLALGPTFEGSFAPDWQWQTSFGPTLNLYRYTLRQSEQTFGTVGGVEAPVGNRFQDSESGNDFGIGFFLRGGITHELTEDWKLNAFLQAEIAESFRVSNEVSSFKVNPSGYSIGLGTTYTF